MLASSHKVTGIGAKFVALLLVALWFPASSHAWLETAGLIHSAQDGHHETSHEAANGHCQFEQPDSGPHSPVLNALPWIAPVLKGLFVLLPPTSPVRLIPCCSTAPPELTRTWQFSERMALPGRAPSFATR